MMKRLDMHIQGDVARGIGASFPFRHTYDCRARETPKIIFWLLLRLLAAGVCCCSCSSRPHGRRRRARVRARPRRRRTGYVAIVTPTSPR
jgi:hypothetical protein